MDEIFAQLETSSPYIAVPIILNAIGYMLKLSKVSNKHIPLLLALGGSLIFQIWSGWNPKHALIGFVVGAASVGFHQGYRQYTNKEINEDSDTSKS